MRSASSPRVRTTVKWWWKTRCVDSALLALRQLLALGVLTTVAVLWGRRAMALILGETSPTSGVEGWGFAVAFGLATLGTALFVLGLVGGLTPLAVTLLAACSILAWRTAGARQAAPAAPAAPIDPAAAVGAPVGRATIVLGALLALPAFVLSLYPPNGFDETTYHLPLAAALARSHHLVLVPDVLYPVSPQLLELLFTALLLTAGDVATHTVQFLCLGAITAAVFAAGERFAGRRSGVVAAALWLANPLVHYQAATAYVDLGMTLFVLLAILAWERWRAGESPRWLVAAGVLVGSAAATKHLGLLWLALLALATWDAAPRGRRWRTTALYLAGAGVTLAPWAARSLWETGNPIFPLLSGWFPGTGSRLEQAVGAPLSTAWLGSRQWGAATLSTLRQPWTLLALPWRAAFDRGSFHLQAPLSPYPLLLLPLVAWQAVRDRRLRRWLLLIVAYAALGTTADLRFQLPSAALFAIAGGIAVMRALESPRLARWARPASVAVLALAIAALGPLYASYKVWRHGPLPATAAARQAFLARELPGYRAIALLNRRCGASYTVFAFDAENLTYYAQGRFLGQRSGPFAQRPLAPLRRDPGRLDAALSRWGVDDLLVNHPLPAAAVPFAVEAGREQLARWFQPLPTGPWPAAELFVLLDEQGRPRAPAFSQAGSQRRLPIGCRPTPAAGEPALRNPERR
jgi:Dolichyl-phosphate-mannose-protein mannosyltransferase